MKSWIEASKIYMDQRVLSIFFLGFSSGLPFLLVFGTLAYWLEEEGVSLATIGFFAILRMPYTLKVFWAPLIDHLKLPILHRLMGRRRSWAIVSQIFLMASIVGLGYSNPSQTLEVTAIMTFAVAFFSATQDILVDAYRIEMLKDDEQGAGAAMYTTGYRVGVLISGAVAIGLSDFISWPIIYTIMASLIVIGMITILVVKEPENLMAADLELKKQESAEYFLKLGKPQWLASFLANIKVAVILPFKDFMTRPSWMIILIFILLYKFGESLVGSMANPFYIQTGFSGTEIASITKFYGLAASAIGGILGGIVVYRYGILKALFICGVIQMLGTLLFALQAEIGYSIPMLMIAITGENITGGMATTAFIAYLSSQCSVAYTATQFALFTSFMALSRDILGSFSGLLAETVGWTWFFIICTAVAIPALLLLIKMIKRENEQTALKISS